MTGTTSSTTGTVRDSAAAIRYTADTVIVDTDDRVLLIERGHPAYQGLPALPGGHVDEGETSRRAAAREALEETGVLVDPDDLVLVGLYDEPDRDPRGRYIGTAYLARVPAGTEARAGDDAASVHWTPIDALPARLAFDHAWILADALRLAAPPTPAPPVHAPFHRPGRTFLTDSVLTDESDWTLATLALHERLLASKADDREADEAERLAEMFTADQARRIDAYLAASVHDTARLAALTTATAHSPADLAWLTGQLTTAWTRLTELHDRIDHSGSLMHTSYAAGAVGYARWSRNPEARTGQRPPRSTTA